MATDGPTPPDCRPDVYKYGLPVCLVYGPSNAIENWVRQVAALAEADVDWHYVGGRGSVLHLGDEESRARVLQVIKDNPPTEPVGMMNIYEKIGG